MARHSTKTHRFSQSVSRAYSYQHFLWPAAAAAAAAPARCARRGSQAFSPRCHSARASGPTIEDAFSCSRRMRWSGSSRARTPRSHRMAACCSRACRSNLSPVLASCCSRPEASRRSSFTVTISRVGMRRSVTLCKWPRREIPPAGPRHRRRRRQLRQLRRRQLRQRRRRRRWQTLDQMLEQRPEQRPGQQAARLEETRKLRLVVTELPSSATTRERPLARRAPWSWPSLSPCCQCH